MTCFRCSLAFSSNRKPRLWNGRHYCLKCFCYLAEQLASGRTKWAKMRRERERAAIDAVTARHNSESRV